MDYTRIAKLHSKLFSVPQNSPEWNKRLSALSEDDRASVFDYDMAIKRGYIEPVKIKSGRKRRANKGE